MFRLPSLNIRAKFMLITTVAIVSVMTFIGSVAVIREREMLYSNTEKQGILLGETLAIPVIHDLIYERLGLIEEGGLLDNYVMEIYKRKYLDLLFISILDVNGRVVSHNDITEYGKIYSDELYLKGLNSKDTVVEYYKKDGYDALFFAVPLVISEKRWGTLIFSTSLKNVDNQLQKTVFFICVFTVFLIAGGFVTVMVLLRRFITPITELSKTMETADERGFDVKVNIKGNDELALLGQQFNSMIARIKEANNKLKEAHDSLVRTEKLASIGILASGVAHEINNPLGGLFNCIEMIKRNPKRIEVSLKYLDLTYEGLKKIENTVNKLLWMSKKTTHRPLNLDLHSAVNNILSFIDYRMRKNNVAFINRCPKDLNIFIDIHDLQQMLLNLFINSLQAMKKGGTIVFDAWTNDSSIYMEIKDTGEGIPEEHKKHIFDPFFTTKSAQEGTGLGLWLTYQIVSVYNGEINFNSEPNRGTVFVIRLPIQEQHNDNKEEKRTGEY